MMREFSNERDPKLAHAGFFGSRTELMVGKNMEAGHLNRVSAPAQKGILSETVTYLTV